MDTDWCQKQVIIYVFFMSILLYESLSSIIKWVFTPHDGFCTSTSDNINKG